MRKTYLVINTRNKMMKLKKNGIWKGYKNKIQSLWVKPNIRKTSDSKYKNKA